MLPCFICGKDASTGWIKGFVPGPDSQKLALCHVHDTPENRGKVTHEWFKLMKFNYQTFATVEAQCGSRAAQGGKEGFPGEFGVSPSRPRLMNIRFLVGGYMSLPCVKYEVTPNGTLEVETTEGHLQSFPLQHIKSYELSSAFDSEFHDASESSAFSIDESEEIAKDQASFEADGDLADDSANERP